MDQELICALLQETYQNIKNIKEMPVEYEKLPIEDKIIYLNKVLKNYHDEQTSKEQDVDE